MRQNEIKHLLDTFNWSQNFEFFEKLIKKIISNEWDLNSYNFSFEVINVVEFVLLLSYNLKINYEEIQRDLLKVNGNYFHSEKTVDRLQITFLIFTLFYELNKCSFCKLLINFFNIFEFYDRFNQLKSTTQNYLEFFVKNIGKLLI